MLHFNKEMAADKLGFLFARKETMTEITKMIKKFPPLLERTFISCENEGKVRSGETSEFRVLQWNVLADGKQIFLLTLIFMVI